MERIDDLSDILRRKSPRDYDRAKRVRAECQSPVKHFSRSTVLGRRACIQEEGSTSIITKRIDAEIGIHTQGFDDLYALDHRTVIRCFVAMKLHSMQAYGQREILQRLRIR